MKISLILGLCIFLIFIIFLNCKKEYLENISFKDYKATTVVSKNADNVFSKDNRQLSPADKNLIAIFYTITNENKNDYNNLDYKPIDADQIEVNDIINYVLNKVNSLSGRLFTKLDLQSANKFIAQRSTGLVSNSDDLYITKYYIQLFILDDNPLQDTDHAKNIDFTIYKDKGQYIIGSINLLGVDNKETKLVDGLDTNSNNYFKILSKWSLSEPYLTSNSRVLFNDQERDQILYKHANTFNSNGYRCFGADYPDITDQEECQKAGGIFDTPVTSSEECPFYKANKNYENEEGGADLYGNCNLPDGIRRISYRYYSTDPTSKPLCYNCPIGADGSPNSVGFCCDDQKTNSTKFVTPDYKFEGDEVVRGYKREELAKKGLYWQAHPNRIDSKDVSANAQQLQPVFNSIIGN